LSIPGAFPHFILDIAAFTSCSPMSGISSTFLLSLNSFRITILSLYSSVRLNSLQCHFTFAMFNNNKNNNNNKRAFLFQRLSVVMQRFDAILLHDSFESADHQAAYSHWSRRAFIFFKKIWFLRCLGHLKNNNGFICRLLVYMLYFHIK